MPDITDIIARLPGPARYLPWQRHTDPLAAGLYRLGHDFGNGRQDQQCFQFDNEFVAYRDNLLNNRAEQLDKYYARRHDLQAVAQAVNRFVITQLATEHPGLFTLHSDADGMVLHCVLTGEHLSFSGDGELLDHDSLVVPGYVDGLDALAAQLQEDLVVMTADAAQHYRACALHLCCPNHWGAASRLDQDFTALHAAVPGFNARHPHGNALLGAIASRGPYLRFVWGLASDTRLNHHPTPAPGADAGQWQGRALDQAEQIFLRIERQVLQAIPNTTAILFSIRTLFIDSAVIDDDARGALCRQLSQMPGALLRYKGINSLPKLMRKMCKEI